MRTFEEYGIDTRGRSGHVKTKCPQCSHTRKNSRDLCLSVNVDEGLWNCHHCGWSGGLKSLGDYGLSRSRPAYRKPTYEPSDRNQEKLFDWFRGRGIPSEFVTLHRISLVSKYFGSLGKEVPAIAFPYYRGGEVVNVKYRALETKDFMQESGAEKILYGLDDLAGCDERTITEGEPDKLACEAAGVSGVVSVPDGAPPTNSKPTDTKFEYIRNCENELLGLKKIILAVDSDGPGQTLAAELARRLGPERCWRVAWPEDCKDANDVLLKHGAAILKSCIDNATPWPLDGIIEVKDLADQVIKLYDEGWPPGASTGWASVDNYFTVTPGQMTIVTGIPGDGKSEWLDALVINLAVLHGWFIGVCSPENWPLEGHVAKLLEKWAGKPFGEGKTARLDHNELANGIQFLQDHFLFFSPPEDNMTLDKVLDLARQAVSRYGIRGLILDPWNELDHTRPANLLETEFVSQCLTKVRRFARNYGVHVWLVAHPTKLRKRDDGTYPVPTPYDISGSSHWRNKADNCLAVYRDANSEGHVVQLHVQKIRFRQVGKTGAVELIWSPVHGRYSEIE